MARVFTGRQLAVARLELKTVNDQEKNDSDEALLGQLERALIDEFIRGRGYDPDGLVDLPPAQREHLLADAALYASGRLFEIESRSHFLDEIRGGMPRIPRTGLD
jgi:hypothetical protein